MAKKQEELQFSGFLDILKQSFNIIFSHPKIFLQIAFFFLLPLACISLVAYLESPSSVPTNTFYANQDLHATPPKTNFTQLALLVSLLLLKLLLSFIPVSVTVYTVACIQNGKEITFTKAIRVIPKVWKQLLMTYMSLYCIYFAIFVVFLIVIVIGSVIGVVLLMSSKNPESATARITSLSSIGFILVSVLFFVGMVYISIIWLLADVVSVLEKICGMKALKKSKSLIKGKIGTTIATYLVMSLFALPTMFLTPKLKSNDVSIGVRICYGVLVLVLSSLVSVLDIVVKTVLYFVCKSYHHEPIDNLHLVDYIEISRTDRAYLKTEEKQVEDLQV